MYVCVLGFSPIHNNQGRHQDLRLDRQKVKSTFFKGFVHPKTLFLQNPRVGQDRTGQGSLFPLLFEYSKLRSYGQLVLVKAIKSTGRKFVIYRNIYVRTILAPRLLFRYFPAKNLNLNIYDQHFFYRVQGLKLRVGQRLFILDIHLQKTS